MGQYRRMLEKLARQNRVPIDSSLDNNPRRVSSAFAQVPVQPLDQPLKIISLSLPALDLIFPGVQRQDIDDRFIQVLSGSAPVSPECPPVAHRYWGTQFGSYAGQLGDGAAMSIGESSTGYEVNLKGSGKTPFSRGFDGRKVIRSSIREFICSEAMAGLHIPTTRAGSVVCSETSKVWRDVNYTGNPIQEKCAVVSRIAKSFLRFGSFESHDPQDKESILNLLEYAWDSHLKALSGKSFIEIVADRTAYLIAEWSCVGFVHGVMNTDNMSIIGDTIDYGPFGFIETFDPFFVPNTSDKFGRYSFSEQPKVAEWNLIKFSNVVSQHLSGVSEKDAMAKYGWKGLSDDDLSCLFKPMYERYYILKMRKKMGIRAELMPDKDFKELLMEFWDVMEFSMVDFTITFRALCDLKHISAEEVAQKIMSTYPPVERVVHLSSQGLRVTQDDLPEIEEFARTRLPELERVGITLGSIARWKNQLGRINRVSTRDPDDLKKESLEKWIKVLNRITPHIDESAANLMKSVNPVYVPRKSLMQKAITLVEETGDCSEVEKLLQLFLNPYREFPNLDSAEMYTRPLLSEIGATLSCSS
jgi:uncharacterized protein YdiU (UPF0061 family)